MENSDKVIKDRSPVSNLPVTYDDLQGVRTAGIVGGMNLNHEDAH